MEFSGGVFSDTIEGRRASATVRITENGLQAITTATGTAFALPFSAMSLEKGGASGRMIFARNPERTVTIFCEAKGFESALRTTARGLLDDEFATISRSEKTAAGTRRRLAVIGVATVAILLVVVPVLFDAVVGCTASALPYSVDEAIGKSAIAAMDLGGPDITDATVTTALDRIVERLEPFRALESATFNVRVVDNPAVNAFALPGGEIVVFSGLFEAAESADEVAAIVAHEMGHVTKRHGMRRLVQSLGVIAAVQLLVGDAGGLIALAGDFFTLHTINAYSREDEYEADAEAVRMMHEAGLDARALARFFERQHHAEHGSAGHGGVPDWFSTHPAHRDRIAAIEAQWQTLPAVEPRPLDLDWDALKSAARSPTPAREIIPPAPQTAPQ